MVTENILPGGCSPTSCLEVAYEVLTSHTVTIHEALEQNVSLLLNLSSYLLSAAWLVGIYNRLRDSTKKLILHTMWGEPQQGARKCFTFGQPEF